MGAALRRSAFSANIKERRDYSCAVFDGRGATPASMGLSREVFEEGLRIPPVRLARGGRIEPDVMALLLANVRTPEERQGDLNAQVAAAKLGERRLREIVSKYGARKVEFYLDALQRYSAALMKKALRGIPDGTYGAEDFLDDDGFGRGPIPLRVAIRIRRGLAQGDFAGTSPAVCGNLNAVLAVTTS